MYTLKLLKYFNRSMNITGKNSKPRLNLEVRRTQNYSNIEQN